MKPVLVLQHVPHETLGSLEQCFRNARVPWRYVRLFRQIPKRLELQQAAGLVVLGGPMNVDEVERYPFLGPEIDWIREAVEAELPLLGVCLGSQLLAKALGAKVYLNPVKEIGWYEIELTREAAEDRLFAGCAERQLVFQWHGDTFDLPHGAVHLCRSKLCPHQAFRHGRSAWGLQFHVEMTAELVDDWLSQPENRRQLDALDYVNPQAIRARSGEALPAMNALGQRLLPRFAEMCRRG